jgi:SOS-response transcriptional repressor LexA
MTNNIGDILQEYRKSKQLSQHDLAVAMTKHGYPTTNKSISSWEKGTVIPNAYQFLALCQILGITNIYSIFIDNNIIDSPLNEEGHSKLREFAHILSKVPEYQAKRIKIPLYYSAVSAGTGEYLDNSDIDTILEVSEPFADYAVRIHGDSMEPLYKDNQIVLVRKTDIIDNNKIGIFVVNNEIYCKKIQGNTLISLNPLYEDIIISELDQFQIMGEVICGY